MAERFSGMNKEILKLYRDFIRGLAKTIPSDTPPDGDGNLHGGNDDGWAEKITRKAVEVFFSMFGTSSAEELEIFSDKLTNVLKNRRIAPGIRRRFIQASRLFEEENPDRGVKQFERGFQALMEGLLLTWIETYKKPLITTTFMEMNTVSEVGYHSYPTPERAALVLTKLMEYREYLDRNKLNLAMPEEG